MNRILVWLALAIGLVLIFEFVPQSAQVPSTALLVSSILVVAWRFLRARQKGTLCWKRKVYWRVEAIHLVLVGALAGAASFAWMAIVLPLVGDSTESLTIFITIPVCIFDFVAGLAISVGFYVARGEW